MINFPAIFEYHLGGNSLASYLLAVGIFLLVMIALKIIKGVVVRRLKKFSQTTATKVDDFMVGVLESISWPLYVILGIGAGLLVLNVPQRISTFFSYLVLLVVALYVTITIQKVFTFSLSRMERTGKVDSMTSRLLSQIGKIILWLIAALLVLQNFGLNITTLVAGLGIGGIAIAFALQNVLGDIFAYFSIHFDKPFLMGDFIIVDQDMGTIEKIGLKSTRIRSLWGEQLIMSNKELTEKRVHNYKKMEERRLQVDFSVIYETPSEKLEKIPQIVRDIFQKIELTRLDRINFKGFGDYGLIFEFAYYVLDPDYNKYMNIQEKFNLALKVAFEKEGIEFAYPTQKIFIDKGQN